MLGGSPDGSNGVSVAGSVRVNGQTINFILDESRSVTGWKGAEGSIILSIPIEQDSKHLNPRGKAWLKIAQNDGVSLIAVNFYDKSGGVVQIVGLEHTGRLDPALENALYSSYMASQNKSSLSPQEGASPTSSPETKSEGKNGKKNDKKMKKECSANDLCCVDNRDPTARKIVPTDQIFKSGESCEVPEDVTCCYLKNVQPDYFPGQVLGCPEGVPQLVSQPYWRIGQAKKDGKKKREKTEETLVTAEINNCNSTATISKSYMYVAAQTNIFVDSNDYLKQKISDYGDDNTALTTFLADLGLNVSLEERTVDVKYEVKGCDAVAATTTGEKTTKTTRYKVGGELWCSVTLPSVPSEQINVADYDTGTRNPAQFGTLTISQSSIDTVTSKGPDESCPHPLVSCGNEPRNCPTEFHAFQKEGLCLSSTPPPSTPEPTSAPQDATPSAITNTFNDL